MDRAGLERAVADQVRDILARAFAADQGTYVFHDQATPAGEDIGLDIVTEDLILEAVRQIADPSVVRYALGETDRTLVLSRGLKLERLRLTTADGYFLSRVDGTLTGREVMEMLPLETTRRSEPCSACSARASWSSRERRRPRSSCPTSPPAPRSGRWSSGMPAAPPRRPLTARAVAPLVARAGRGDCPWKTRSPRKPWPRRSVRWPKADPRKPRASSRPSIDLVEGDLRRRVRRLLAEALLADPRSEKRGESQLHILVAESPDDVEAYFMLGNVYKRRGLRSRADAMFRRVLDLAPGHAGARPRSAAPPEAPKPACRTGLWDDSSAARASASGNDQHLARGLPAFERPVGLGRLREREGPADPHLELSRGDLARARRRPATRGSRGRRRSGRAWAGSGRATPWPGPRAETGDTTPLDWPKSAIMPRGARQSSPFSKVVCPTES